MLRASVLLFMMLFFKNSLAAEESLDLAFLEWLGQTAEVEELGVDIEELLLQKEGSQDTLEEKSQ